MRRRLLAWARAWVMRLRWRWLLRLDPTVFIREQERLDLLVRFEAIERVIESMLPPDLVLRRRRERDAH